MNSMTLNWSFTLVTHEPPNPPIIHVLCPELGFDNDMDVVETLILMKAATIPPVVAAQVLSKVVADPSVTVQVSATLLDPEED